MTTTGLHVFDRTLHETNIWLKTLMEKLQTDNREVAYWALRASLHAVRDRIGPQNAVHLGAQLPMLIRGIYYEGWHMAASPTRERHKADFLDHVRRELDGRLDIDPERAVRATFDVMWAQVDPGEMAKVIEMFPMELRDFWPRLARKE
jgi:uncharacterized protein (DUF2267 family)